MKRLIDGHWIDATGSTELPHNVTGIFETLLLRETIPLFWREHWSRFEAGCRWAGFATPTDENQLYGILSEAARQNNVSAGVARFATWRETSATVRWCVDVTHPRPHMSHREFVVRWGGLLPATTDDRAFKHLDRAVWTVALRSARTSGADEALLCDQEGHLVEGCVSNVFLVRDHQLWTPPLRSGPLPGIMRQQVITFARSQGWPVHEADYRTVDVATASEIWLTNSLIGIRPVIQLAGQILPPHRPFLDQFRTAWRQTHGYDPVIVT